MRKPYFDRQEEKVINRTFNNAIDESELKWHRDFNDRYITVVKSKGWSLQLENTLPVDLVEGVSYFIEKDEWHRILKGEGQLVIKIAEY